MGSAPSRGSPKPTDRKVVCPACHHEFVMNLAPPIKVPCPECGQMISFKVG